MTVAAARQRVPRARDDRRGARGGGLLDPPAVYRAGDVQAPPRGHRVGANERRDNGWFLGRNVVGSRAAALGRVADAREGLHERAPRARVLL